jgi:flagellar FliL protein
MATTTQTGQSRENRTVSKAGGARATKPGVGSKSGEADEVTPKAKRNPLKSKKFVIILIAVLVLGGGAYMFLKPKKAVPPSGGDVVAMDATTLNLTDGHYLKIAVAIQLVKGKASSTDFATSHAAELVIDEFSNRSVTSLSSNAARQKLVGQLRTSIQKAYPGEVYDIFVTQFVTQ